MIEKIIGYSLGFGVYYLLLSIVFKRKKCPTQTKK